MKTCQHCGEPFTPNKRAPHQKYCKVDCRKAAKGYGKLALSSRSRNAHSVLAVTQDLIARGADVFLPALVACPVSLVAIWPDETTERMLVRTGRRHRTSGRVHYSHTDTDGFDRLAIYLPDEDKTEYITHA